MMARYEPPPIDPDVQDAMDTFMRAKGVDPDALPLYH